MSATAAQVARTVNEAAAEVVATVTSGSYGANMTVAWLPTVAFELPAIV